MKNCLRSWRLSADSKTNAYGSKVIGGPIYDAAWRDVLPAAQILGSSSNMLALVLGETHKRRILANAIEQQCDNETLTRL
jgi:hypothetical protein